ncbi:MAG: PLDc N-terminal domain-containing protein [Candidatus Pacearchaeota archaeon]
MYKMAFLESLFVLIALGCTVWVIYDVLINNKKMTKGLKIIWIIGAIFFNIITATVYYFVEKRK